VLHKYKTAKAVGRLARCGSAPVHRPAVSTIVYQHILVPMREGTPDEKIIADCIDKTKKVLDVYEARLSKYKYLAGDFISLSDLSHFHITYYFMTRTPYASVLDSYPSVKAWWEDLMSRPAVQRVISQLPKSTDDEL
jgi:glutathione S-transferase